MNFEQLEYILMVANEKSIAKAAEKLHITSSGLSQSISQLEKELNITIFHRSRMGTIVTNEGKLLLESAAEIIMNKNIFHEKIDKFRKMQRNHLKILCAPTFTHVVYQSIMNLSDENKDLTYEITDSLPSKLSDINKFDFDIAFLYKKVDEIEIEENLEWKPLYKGYTCVAVGKKSPLYSLNLVTPEDLIKKQIVTYTNSFMHLKEPINRYQHEVIFTSNNGPMILEKVLNSQAISYVHDFTIKNHRAVISGDLKILPLIIDSKYLHFDFGVVYQKNKDFTLLENSIIESVVSKIKS